MVDRAASAPTMANARFAGSDMPAECASRPRVEAASTGNLSAANVGDSVINIVQRCHMRNQFAEWCIRGIEQAHVARNIILRNRLAAVRADQPFSKMDRQCEDLRGLATL